jgi:undecaprenyl-diphosphatase
MRDPRSTEEASQRTRAAQRPHIEAASSWDKWDLVLACVSLVVLVVSLLLAQAELTAAEVQIFRAVNELPQSLNAVVWPFMQYGTFVTIPALAVIALLFHRFRLSLAIALAGVGVYLLALVVKQIAERGRPGALLTGVEGREEFGAESLGFPSGHAAVAAALTVVVAAHLSVRWTIVAIVLGAVVVFGRIYVGAHMPLDVIGGAALGAVVGSAVNMIVPPAGHRE